MPKRCPQSTALIHLLKSDIPRWLSTPHNEDIFINIDDFDQFPKYNVPQYVNYMPFLTFSGSIVAVEEKLQEHNCESTLQLRAIATVSEGHGDPLSFKLVSFLLLKEFPVG